MPSALMRQATVPDDEIASPRRHLDDVMFAHIDRGVHHRTRVVGQISIEVPEDRGNTREAARTRGGVRQEEHPLIRTRARRPRVEIPMHDALVDMIRMGPGLRYLEDPAIHRDPQLFHPPDLGKDVVHGRPLPDVLERLRVVHRDNAPHERLVPVPGVGTVEVSADEGADDVPRGVQQPVGHETGHHGVTVAGQRVTLTSCQHGLELPSRPPV